MLKSNQTIVKTKNKYSITKLSLDVLHNKIATSDNMNFTADKDIQRNIPFTPSEATAKHVRLLTRPNVS